MLEKLARFVVEKRVFVIVMIIALVIVGGRAVTTLPIEAFPDVQDVQVVIISQQAGQAPEEMERSISLPIERALAGTPGVNDIRSVSITGLSVVTLIFNDGTDDYFARSQVLEKLRDADLPDGVVPSLAPLSTAVGEVYRYVLDKPKDMPLYEARAIQDFVVRPALRMVPGVADVTSFGGSIKQYQILIKPDLLKRYGVTIADIQTAVGSANSNVGGGVIPRGDEVVVVRGVGLYKSIEDVGNTVIKAKNGNTVRVADIADVQIGTPERSGMVAYDHQDDVSEGIVTMVKRQNAAVVVDGVRDAVDQLNAQFRADAQRTGRQPIQIKPTYQRTKLLDRTVETVAENLVVGATLVTVLLLVFLRNWRAALVVAAIIPLALLAAFAGLNTVSVPANLISMGAVDFGIIIDSAVVLVEALMVALALEAAKHDGVQPDKFRRNQVLRNTVTNLARPILFSKAIIIMAFVPIFTFQRVEGKMFSPVALTLSFALGAALVLTLSFLPAVLSFLVERYDMAEKHIGWMDKLRNGYRDAVQRALPKTRPVIIASAVVLAITIALIPRLGSEFLPKLDEGNIWLTVQLTPSASMETTRRVEAKIRNIMLSYPEVAHVGSEAGRPDDGTDPKGPSSLQMLIDLKPRGEWRSQFPTKAALEDDMRKKVDSIPGVPTNFSQAIEDSVEESLSGVKGEISIKIIGKDLNILEALGEETARVVAAVPGASDVGAVKIGGQTEVRAILDRDAMARYGLNANDANTAIATAFGGAAVGTAYEGDRNFDIMVRFAPDQRNAVDDLAQLQVPLPDGGTISLGEIAHIDVQVGASRISRENGSRNVAIKANVDGRDQGSFVADAQKAVAEKIKLPSGYQMVWGGQFENQQRAMKRLEVIVPIALFGIFILLFGAFRSVRSAALILAMVPFTTVGGVAALAAAGLHMSVSAAVGFIAVAGISVQNGVVMLEHITHRYDNGDSFAVAVIEGAVDRLRPILMTALMAGLGLLPAALSTGIGSETQRPFACVIVGGIVSATLFMLILLPLSLIALQKRTAARAGENDAATAPAA